MNVPFLKIHENTNNYSYIVDISVSIRNLHQRKNVSDRHRNVSNVRIIGCLDEMLIFNWPSESEVWLVSRSVAPEWDWHRLHVAATSCSVFDVVHLKSLMMLLSMIASVLSTACACLIVLANCRHNYLLTYYAVRDYSRIKLVVFSTNQRRSVLFTYCRPTLNACVPVSWAVVRKMGGFHWLPCTGSETSVLVDDMPSEDGLWV